LRRAPASAVEILGELARPHGCDLDLADRIERGILIAAVPAAGSWACRSDEAAAID
jgi:hypothetical protein